MYAKPKLISLLNILPTSTPDEEDGKPAKPVAHDDAGVKVVVRGAMMYREKEAGAPVVVLVAIVLFVLVGGHEM